MVICHPNYQYVFRLLSLLGSGYNTPALMTDRIALAEEKNRRAWELRNSDARQALAIAEEALALIGDVTEISPTSAAAFARARSLLIAGASLNRLSRYPEAMAKSEEALFLYSALEIHATDAAKEGQALALNTIGNIYHARGDLAQALEHHERSLRIKVERGDRAGHAISLNNIGNAYHELGDLAHALEYHLESLRIREDLKDLQGQQSSLLNLGRVYHLLTQYDRAEDCYERSYLLGEQTSALYEQALALHNIGLLANVEKDHRTALAFFQRSLGLFEEIGGRANVAGVLSDIGAAYGDLGDTATSLEYQERAAQLSLELGDQIRWIIAVNNQAVALIALNRIPEALALMHKALITAEILKAKRLIYRTHEALSLAYERQGDLARALQHLKQYQAIKEEAQSEEAAQKIRSLQVLHEVEQARQEAEIYRLRNLELSRANRELRSATLTLEQHAHTDSLTGLFNRRYLDRALISEWECVRQNSDYSLAIALADIDHFKQINDRFLHQIGDSVLQIVADILRRGVRHGDIVSRYGGEEFAILLPRTSLSEATSVCERIRLEVASYPWPTLHPDLQNLTISFGVAATGDGTAYTDIANLLRDADAHLYAAKQDGRNRVEG